MRIRTRLTASALCCAAAFSPSAAPAQQRTVDTLVRSFIRRHQIPGASIAVIRDGAVVVNSGYGTANIELGVPATGNTVYEIGSISKHFTAAAILLLVEQGELSLDDRASRYMPGWPPAWNGVTIRHLVTHTGGIPDWESRTSFSYHRDYTGAEFLQLIAPLPLDFAPGDKFSYTNTGAPLLGLIIREVTGVPFEEFVAENLFRRATLHGIRFKHQAEIVSHRAGGYVDSAGALRNGEPHRPSVIAPSGGIMSTARDLVQWMHLLNSGRILSPASVATMTSPIRLNNGTPFSAGMGWFLDEFRGHANMLHNGSTVGGFSSVVYWYPDERLGVAVLMNTDRFNAVNTLATMVAGVVAPGLSIASLKERTDPDPAFSGRLLAMLNAVAEGQDSDLLADNLRIPGAASRARRDFGFEGVPRRFAFLEREDRPADSPPRFGNTIRSVYRYRLFGVDKVINYTFELTPAGTVARFVAEGQ